MDAESIIIKRETKIVLEIRRHVGNNQLQTKRWSMTRGERETELSQHMNVWSYICFYFQSMSQYESIVSIF